jgi:hypothetical protein
MHHGKVIKIHTRVGVHALVGYVGVKIAVHGAIEVELVVQVI